MKKRINGLLALLLVLITQITFAQDMTISGIVSDSNGLSIPGANVKVKGTNNGTSTDFDGTYKIKAKSSDVLVFSFQGMNTQELKVSGVKMNARLASKATELEGVVVTALGIKREKKSLGYGTQEIKGSEMNSGVSSGNFLNELSGKIAGVAVRRNNNFGGSTNIVSRGIKNLTGNNQMLVVIDGMPINNSNNNSNASTGASSTGAQNTGRGTTYDYGNTAMDINPDDIESINVLKGAAASALYGYLAGNGALVITTKKGKSGKNGIGVTISSDVSTGFIDKSTFVKYQKKYGQGYGPFYEDATGFFLDRDIDGDGINDLVTPTQEDASYGAAFDPSLQVYNWNAFTPYSNNYKKQTAWVAAENDPITFFKTPLNISNSVSLEGGDEKSNFVLNFNNSLQNGIMPNSELKKNSLSLRAGHQFNDKLSATVFGNFTAQGTIGRNSTGYNDNILSTFRQWWNTGVDIQELKSVFEKSGGQNITWNWNDPKKLVPIYWDNPYFTRYKNYQSDERNRFIGYGKLDYKVNSWFTASAKISTDTYSELREERRAAGSVAGEFGINRLDEKSGYQKFNRNFSEQNYELLLSFKKNIITDLSFNGLLGGNTIRNKTNSTLASTQGGLIVPGIYSLENSVATSPFPRDYETNTGVNSLFGSVSFGYKDFLFVDGTYRRDAFSVLPKAQNTLSTKSLSGSFVFSSLLNLKWLTFGKLRGGYAESPLDAPLPFSIFDTYDKFDPFGTNQLFSNPSTKNNPDLQPVKSKTNEIGIEMQFFNKRFGFDISSYKSINEGQIFPVSFSNASGYTSKYINAGTVQNKGIEIQMNLTPLKSKDFQWDIFVNWSKNKNEVTELAPGIENLQLGAFQGGVTINAEVGKPYGSLKGTDYTYLNGERVVSTTGAWVINTSTNNTIGNVTPDWIGGLRNKFTYKTVSLGFLIDMQKGGDIFSLDQSYGQATGLYEETAGLNDLGLPMRNTIANGGGIILPGVQADGSVNTIRTASPNQYGTLSGYRRAPNKAFVYDASFVKLREVSLTFNLPSKFISNLKISELKFSIVGSNLWIISKNLPYADPESGLGSGNLSSGYSIGSLPTTRNVGFNVTLKF